MFSREISYWYLAIGDLCQPANSEGKRQYSQLHGDKSVTKEQGY